MTGSDIEDRYYPFIARLSTMISSLSHGRRWRLHLLSRQSFRERKFATCVLSFGDNSFGALGLGEDEYTDAYDPEPIPDLQNSSVAKIASGHFHSFAITETGQLYSWGRNREGQLGHKELKNDFLDQACAGFESVKVVDAIGSGVVSMAISSDGSVWSWGSSKRGQLGLGETVLRAHAPRRIMSLQHKHVRQVALGWGHALALTLDGEVYGWGYAKDGRLGFDIQKSNSYQQLRKRINAHFDVAHVKASLHEIESEIEKDMLKEEEEMMACIVWDPMRIEALKNLNIIQVACGMDHSLVLTDDGKVYGFGQNGLSQLGSSVHAESQRSPVPVAGFSDDNFVYHIAAGLSHSLAAVSRSNAVLDEDDTRKPGNRILSWGYDPVCGKDSAVHLFSNKVSKLSAGRVHNAVMADGKLWTWGSGKNGRLGLSSSNDHDSPAIIDGVHVLDAVCGFDHTLALVRT